MIFSCRHAWEVKAIQIDEGAVAETETADAYNERIKRADSFERLIKSGAVPLAPGSIVMRVDPTTVWILPIVAGEVKA